MRGINEISGLEIFTGVNFSSIYHNHAKVFLERSQIMNQVCKSQSCRFFRILQPTLGYGNYSYDLSDEVDKKLFEESNCSEPHVKNLPPYYDEIRERISSLKWEFIHDATHIFDNTTRQFSDFRHPNCDGYRLISEYIGNLISPITSF